MLFKYVKPIMDHGQKKSFCTKEIPPRIKFPELVIDRVYLVAFQPKGYGQRSYFIVFIDVGENIIIDTKDFSKAFAPVLGHRP